MIKLLLLSALLLPSFVLADIYRCGDTWQNKPCMGEAGSVPLIPEREEVKNNDREDSGSDAEKRRLREHKEHLWRLQGRYPSAVVKPFEERITQCESDLNSVCLSELSKVAQTVTVEVEKINQERAVAQEKKQLSDKKLALEEERLKELKRQNEIEQEKLRELRRNNNIISDEFIYIKKHPTPTIFGDSYKKERHKDKSPGKDSNPFKRRDSGSNSKTEK